jgi:hypothetical protein
MCSNNKGKRLGAAEGTACCCKKTVVQATLQGLPSGLCKEESGNTIKCNFLFGMEKPGDLATRILRILLGVVGSLGLLMFVWGGFLWLTAAGEERRIKQGWNTMVWAAIGMAAIFGAYVITKFIIDALMAAST